MIQAGAMRCFAQRRVISHIRPFSSTSVKSSFFGNLFGSKEVKQRQDIIEKQDDYEIDPESKIVILDESNSPEKLANTIDPATDLPDFAINQWKFSTIKRADIETTYSSPNDEKLSSVLLETYNKLASDSASDLAKLDFSDLQFRFDYFKLLQQNLGFDIGDYTISRSHNGAILLDELSAIVNHRFTNERNANAIVLRKEDFTSKNIYLNKELNDFQQEKVYEKLVSEASAQEQTA